MSFDEFRTILGATNNYLEAILMPIMTILIFIKLRREKRETGEINYVRAIIGIVFACFSWMVVWEFLYNRTPVQMLFTENIVTFSETSWSFYNIGLSLTVAFGLVIVMYINRRESLYYVPLFVVGGMWLYYIFTGYYEMMMYFIYIGALMAIFFLIYTGFKYKENGSLGLAIFFLLAVMVLLIDGAVATFFNSAYIIFGVIFSLGIFKPFKEVVKE